MHKKWNITFKIIFVPILLFMICLAGYLLLVLAYCIPENLMDSKMSISSSFFMQEGRYQRLTNHENSQPDYFTDALMLLTASHPKNENVWKSAVHAARYLADGKDPCETLVYLYQENGLEVQDSLYPRYWHGYLVLLKPLLVFCSYSTIRYLMMFVQFGLFTLLIVKLAETDKLLVVPVFLSWIFLNPMATMLSLQLNSMFIVAFLSMLFLVYQKQRWKGKWYRTGLFFLVVGSVTSYIDLLTYPLVTLGLPLVLWLALNYSESIKENIKKVVCFSVFWTSGYGFMWGSKWILGSIITGENTIENAVDAIRFRTSSSVFELDFSFWDVLIKQFRGSYQSTWLVAVMILAVFLIFMGIRVKKGMFPVMIPCLLISIYPLIWYAVLKNHSYIHYWFTYRELAISLYAFTTFVAIYIGGGGSIMDKIAVLLPCYNESSTIGKVVTDFKRVLPEAVVYVYDNNSTDGTDVIAKRAGAVVRCEYQQGKGNVIRRMFRDIDAECYIIADGDDTYPAEAARKMTDMVLDRKADMVVGDRLSSTYFEENKRPFHNFGNSLVRKSINLLFKNDIKDIMTGYRAFSYEFVKTFPVLSKGFEIETEMSIHAVDKNMFIQNVVINYRDRPKGSESKLDTCADGLKILRTIVRLYRTYRPMGFFGGLALFLAVVSICFFIPIISLYFRTGLVPNFPTLIVCGFTMLAAIQSFFTGLMLQTMLQKNRQDFEMELQYVSERKNLLLIYQSEFTGR